MAQLTHEALQRLEISRRQWSEATVKWMGLPNRREQLMNSEMEARYVALLGKEKAFYHTSMNFTAQLDTNEKAFWIEEL